MTTSHPAPTCQVLLGSRTREEPQYAVLGTTHGARGRRVGLNLNTTLTAVMVGMQGVGKSYTLGTIVESFVAPIPGINVLPRPGCAVIFHYSRDRSYRPEWTTMTKPNARPEEVEALGRDYQGTPTGVKEVVILTPPDLVDETRAEFPDVQVEPLQFHESELTVDSWINLMGGAETDTLEVQVLLDLMRRQRDRLSIDTLKASVEEHPYLSSDQKFLLTMRLNLAERFISRGKKLADHLKPGRVVIIDLRDEFMDESTAFRIGLCVLTVFQRVTDERGERFPKLLAFDEGHEYARDPFLIARLERLVRLMRHLGMVILFASQDPPSVPIKVLELSSLIFILGMETPDWVAHLAKCKAQIGKILVDDLLTLTAGQCFVWSRMSTDHEFSAKPQRIQIRPRASQHGGATKTAVVAP